MAKMFNWYNGEIAVITNLLMIFVVMGCGVRGRPQPPIEPAFIGQGYHQIFFNKKDPSKSVVDPMPSNPQNKNK